MVYSQYGWVMPCFLHFYCTPHTMKITITSTKSNKSTAQGERVTTNKALEVLVAHDEVVGLTEREQDRIAARARAEELHAQITKLHTATAVTVAEAISENDWGTAADVLKLYSATKGVATTAKARLAKMINRALSMKEVISVDESTEVDTAGALAAYSKALAKVKEENEAILARAETVGRTKEEASLDHLSFDTSNDPEINRIRRDLSAKGTAAGRAAIVCIVGASLDRVMLQNHFNVSFQGSYMILKGQTVVGITSDHARRTFVKNEETTETDWRQVKLPEGYLKD